ncbi:MAG TPA: hypothetical protein VJL81_02345 [Solirubrobacterales bacterium]|nr:hypothetical protein [Solirubrobacterales bacterium]
MPNPREPTQAEADARLALARARQELTMRWLLFLTIIAVVLASSLTTLLYGPPSWHFALVQGTWATLLGWLVRRLFN